ncbi:hypothetical protein GLAREA_12563 [Glarea lozoyensis ATCC 20868]|uniref:Uncharacterized protein n=1 Tax=Glarea lozoyensis (strain ATCC 20868 / MF5171) TaxID=1116229 RepID=S3D092_GLAL2|nr:uncharacterized protein GLAREA_12563 [Glarea lozoyensis ATCC 20868]EPE31260.1 hypothetical protein GLAREA_12563 [Glarea lozoyensis ATCC 20868]
MPGGEDQYHWALIVGPKQENETATGWRYHARERMAGKGGSKWYFEERDIGVVATSMLLVRILVGKVEKMERIQALLRTVPIRSSEPGWNCVG